MRNLLISVSSIFILMLVFGCQKESQTNNRQHQTKVSERDNTLLTLQWITDFQLALQSAVESESYNSPYTVEETILGLETLISTATPMSSDKLFYKQSVAKTQMSFENHSNSLKHLYEQSYSALLNHFNSISGYDTKLPVSFDIQLDSTVSGMQYLSVRTIVGVSNECLTDWYQTESEPCEAFAADVAIRIGLGDEELIISDEYLNDLPCETPCGDLAACEPGSLTAFEEIEAAINMNFPKPTSTDPNSPFYNPDKPYFRGFTDIKCDGFINSSEMGGIFANELCEPSHPGYAKDCLDSDALNCRYCALLAALINHDTPNPSHSYPNPIDIPNGYYLSSINIAALRTTQSFYPCDNTSHWVMEYCYGIPVFSDRPLPPPGWDDPVLAEPIDPQP